MQKILRSRNKKRNKKSVCYACKEGEKEPFANFLLLLPKTCCFKKQALKMHFSLEENFPPNKSRYIEKFFAGNLKSLCDIVSDGRKK